MDRKFFDNLHFVKSGVKFLASFGSTIGDLWDICGLSIPRLYNNAAKIFGAEDVLCRRLENLEGKMVYTTRGKCSVYYASRVSVFFLKKVLVCRKLCRKFNNLFQVDCGLGDHFATTVAHLWASCVLSVAIVC